MDLESLLAVRSRVFSFSSIGKFRNILPDKEWEHSIATMIPTAYKDEDGEPIDHVTNPDKQLAHKALGDYGPLGVKVSNDDFLQ